MSNGAWESNTERRIGILEQKVDKLLDPETGIYSLIANGQRRLLAWAVAILTALVGNLALLLVVLDRSGG